MPLLSIITINYNNADGLKRTLESVKRQTFNDYEHIIIDGGSTDGSFDVIQDFLKDENYAHKVSFWCSEKDGGIYNAMNKGIDHAGGIFVEMLNSGDMFTGDCLSHIAPYLKENPNSVIYGANDYYDGTKYIQTLSYAAENLSTIMIPHEATFVPLSIYKKHGKYDESFRIVADREFMLRLKDNGVNFIHIPVIVTDFSMDGVSSTNPKITDKENYRINTRNFSKTKIFFLKARHCSRIVLELILPGIIIKPFVYLIRKIRNRK